MPRAVATMLSAFPEVRFRALDGHAELAVAEAVASSGSRPARVTGIIAAMCEEVAGEPADAATVRRISAAGREWLLQRSALRFLGGGDWFEARCEACGAHFDLRMSLTDVPHAAPGPGYPVAEVDTSLGRRQFEAPNGGHEEAFARHHDEDPRRVFAALCGLSERAEAEAIRFDAHDLARIDAAIEAVSPEIADSVDATCLECGTAAKARIDPLGFAFPSASEVFREVHSIASAYHWSETSILRLSQARRRTYADLIRAERGGQAPQRRRLS